MKKTLIVIISTLVLVSCSDELKFVCTDVSYSGTELSTRKIQKMKDEVLGSKATLHFYDNCVKIYTDVEGETVVLDKKTGREEYEYIDQKPRETYRTVITLDKSFGYIKGFTAKGYKNGELQGTIIFVRDEWLENIVDLIDGSQ
ncbi:MAG: hypothetical protein K6B13_10920 [Prevotella sp.]|nr:hypothetical protein [Prevotella sp.]